MPKTTVAVFDFDKTITVCDSLVPFLIDLEGPWKTFAKLSWLLPSFIAFGLGNLPRQTVKEKILTSFLKDMPLTLLQERGRQYAQHNLNRLVKAEAIERLKWHQQKGHRCILVSASIDCYLMPWAQQHGFSDALTSILETTAENNVTGKLRGKNCWGEEKKRRLTELLGPKEQYVLYMYGDSQGDQELLEMADYPFYRKFS
jgi:HAD superfamily hydrolase (TIGR01490 family)